MVRLIPWAKVEVAEPVELNWLAAIPPVKVEVAVEVETMFPARKMLPWTERAEPGEVVPMPTFPEVSMTNLELVLKQPKCKKCLTLSNKPYSNSSNRKAGTNSGFLLLYTPMG